MRVQSITCSVITEGFVSQTGHQMQISTVAVLLAGQEHTVEIVRYIIYVLYELTDVN